MFDDYFQFAPRLGIVLGGITVCLAVGFVAMSRGASFSDLAGHTAEHRAIDRRQRHLCGGRVDCVHGGRRHYLNNSAFSPNAITFADSIMSSIPTHSSGRWARSRMPGP